MADTPEGRAAIWSDFTVLQKWADKDLMKFNEEMQQLRALGPIHLERSVAEQGPGGLTKTELTMCKECALDTMKTAGILGCIKQFPKV